MSAPAVTVAERQRMRKLHAEGLSCQQIARQIGRGKGTVSKHCADMGLSFVRTQTEAASTAHAADMRAWRAQKLKDIAAKIDGELARFDQPAIVFSIGGRDNVYTEQVMPEPPAEMRYTMARTIGVLLDRHLRIAEFDMAKDEGGASDVDSFLAALTEGAGR